LPKRVVPLHARGNCHEEMLRRPWHRSGTFRVTTVGCPYGLAGRRTWHGLAKPFSCLSRLGSCERVPATSCSCRLRYLVVEHVEAEGGLRLRLAIELFGYDVAAMLLVSRHLQKSQAYNYSHHSAELRRFALCL